MSPTPSKGLACLQSKLSIPSFLNYRKTLNSGAAPEIPPATIRSADNRCAAWATPAAVIMRGDSARRSVQPLILLHTILREKVPLSYAFFWQMIRYPFLIINLEFCLPFNQCKGTAFEIWIYHKTRTFSRLFHSFRINLLALLGLFTYRNNPITLHFHILQPVKSPPFHIPEAWKRFPFQAEPPRIRHCNGYFPPPPPPPRGK